jgi:predicted HicB family RNase H-like nuclease
MAKTQDDPISKISVFLDHETHMRAKDAAAREGKSLSEFVADLVTKRLKSQAKSAA